MAVENSKQDAKVKGVVITVVEEGIAKQAGLMSGDVITQINGLDITDVKSFESALKATESNQVLRILIDRQGNTYFVAVRKDDSKKK